MQIAQQISNKITNRIINKQFRTMKKSIFFSAVFAILAFTSCNKENQKAQEVAKYITINGNIGAITRVATTGNSSTFEEGDKISVYAWTGTPNVVNSAAMVVNNTVNTLQNSKWVAEPMMKWLDMVVPHFFFSVYPTRVITDFTADVVVVTPTDQTASDLLVAVNTGEQSAGLNATNNPVTLQFQHVMSRVDVKLSYRNEFPSTPAVTSVTTEATKTGTIDYLTGIITPTGTATLFDLPMTKANEHFSSVIVPQSVQKITITIDGKEYIYIHAQPIVLNSGKVQVVKLIVGRNRVELDQITIGDWGNEQEIEGGEAVD